MQAEQFSSGWRSSEDLQKKQEQLLLTIVDNVVCVAVALARAPAAAVPVSLPPRTPRWSLSVFFRDMLPSSNRCVVTLIRLHVLTRS